MTWPNCGMWEENIELYDFQHRQYNGRRDASFEQFKATAAPRCCLVRTDHPIENALMHYTGENWT